MSRAFVKEPDGDESADDLPERPDDGTPNWITPAGLHALEARVAEIESELAELDNSVDDRPAVAALERDLRTARWRLGAARVIDPASQPTDRVHFGAEVEAIDANGEKRVFGIVGEDEVDIAAGRVSWQSPLARALAGAAVGDVVTWTRPAGDLELEVTAIRYPRPESG